jgi:hypothetical protein
MLRIVLALVLFAHAVGHILGPLQLLGISNVKSAWQGDTWLLSGLGPTLNQVLGVVLWSVAMAGFLAIAALVMNWLPADWWAPLAIGSAVLSLVSVVLFPGALPTLSLVGAVAVDLIVLLAVVWLHWTPAALAD